MSDPFEHVHPGDPLRIRASTFNTMLDAAADFARRRNNIAAEARPERPDRDVILVRNNSGADRDRFDVLGLDEPLILPDDNLPEFQSRMAFSGITPALPTHAGRFCILLEPLPAGAIGRALVSGVGVARVAIADPNDAFADVLADDGSKLGTGHYGAARLLWSAGTSGTQWAVVQLAAADGARLRLFEMTDALDCGGTAAALERRWLDGVLTTLDPEDGEFTAADTFKLFSKPATTPGDVGAMGLAVQFPGQAIAHILTMQTPGDFFGALKADLSHADASAIVEVIADTGVWNGYSIFGVNHGNQTTAYNPSCAAGGNIAHWFAGYAGDRVLCRWDIRNARYWIVAIEPNNHGWQSLDVVTGVDFVGQTATKKSIELPPWTEIAAV